MTKEELQKIIAIDEGFRIELTTSTGNMDKFQEAICAFANDMPGSGKKGYLLIGVYDDGKISGMKVDDALMKRISGIRSDGNESLRLLGNLASISCSPTASRKGNRFLTTPIQTTIR